MYLFCSGSASKSLCARLQLYSALPCPILLSYAVEVKPATLLAPLVKVMTPPTSACLHVQEAQVEVLGLKLELGAAAEQNRKYAEDLQRVQTDLSDQTQQALLVKEEAARLKAELAQAKAKSVLTLEVGSCLSAYKDMP